MILSVLPLAIGPWQIAIVVGLALLFFGGKAIGKKLGGAIKSTGEGVKEFKKALKEDESKEEKEEEE
tara:strand:- start:140 stop:340 length:201 start_codon:yes stop_codon:yes gene_type:complete